MTYIAASPFLLLRRHWETVIEVPTLEEKEKIKIPKGTQNGNTLRLKGKGIPHLRGYGRGDQIIEIFVQTPVNLNGNRKTC